MRVKSVHNRTKFHPSNFMGVRDGKLYYDRYGDGFTPTLMGERYLSSGGSQLNGSYLFRNNAAPEAFESTATCPSVTNSGARQQMCIGHLRGLKTRPFVSTKGVTAGKSFVCAGFGIQATDGSLGLCSHQWSNVAQDIAAISNLEFQGEIVYESAVDFFVYFRWTHRVSSTYGLARMYRVPKDPAVAVSMILCGYFDCIFLGLHKGAATPRPTFAIFSNSCWTLSASGTNNVAIVAPATGATNDMTTQPSTGMGENLMVLSLDNEANAGATASWSWLLSRRIGKGKLNGNMGGLKLQISSDRSMIVNTVDGYLKRFSYIGHIPEISAETWNYTGVNGPVQEQLQQNFGVVHLDFSTAGDGTTPFVTASNQQINLPQELLDVRWTCNGSAVSGNNNSALAQGRAWRVGNKQYALLTNATTFALYASGGTGRVDPDMPIALLQADVDANGALSNPTFTLLPARLGASIQPSCFLLSEDGKIVWMPDAKRTALIGVLDLRSGSPVVSTVSVPSHIAYGTDGSNLLVVTEPYQELKIVEFGNAPNFTMTFDKSSYSFGEAGTLTVTADANVTAKLRLMRCVSQGNREVTLTLVANTPQQLPVRIEGIASAHVVSVE